MGYGVRIPSEMGWEPDIEMSTNICEDGPRVQGPRPPQDPGDVSQNPRCRPLSPSLKRRFTRSSAQGHCGPTTGQWTGSRVHVKRKPEDFVTCEGGGNIASMGGGKPASSGAEMNKGWTDGDRFLEQGSFLF